MQLKHLNQKELARRWNISHRTLERWRWAGEGPQFILASASIIDAVLSAVLPLVHFQVDRACEPVAALQFVSLRWFSP